MFLYSNRDSCTDEELTKSFLLVGKFRVVISHVKFVSSNTFSTILNCKDFL